MALTTGRFSVGLINEDVSNPRLGSLRGADLTSRKERDEKPNRRRSEGDMTRGVAGDK